MQQKEWRTVDKAAYGSGPWDDEPDKMQFVDPTTGLPCLIVRNHAGALCGYVGVTDRHPWYGKQYGDYVSVRPEVMEREIDMERTPVISLFLHAMSQDKPKGKFPIDLVLDVHGGVTFTGPCSASPDPSEGICHSPDPGDPDDVWWFGFDCAHSDDFCPRYANDVPFTSLLNRGTYRGIEYVKSEIAKMAAQLAAITVPLLTGPQTSE